MPRAAKKRGAGKADSTNPSQSQEPLQEAPSKAPNRRLSFSQADSPQAIMMDVAEPSSSSQSPAAAVAEEPLNPDSGDNLSAGVQYFCDTCNKSKTEEEYTEGCCVCQDCNHLITPIEGELPESTATGTDIPKPKKRRVERKPTGLKQSQSMQSQPSGSFAPASSSQSLSKVQSATPEPAPAQPPAPAVVPAVASHVPEPAMEPPKSQGQRKQAAVAVDAPAPEQAQAQVEAAPKRRGRPPKAATKQATAEVPTAQPAACEVAEIKEVAPVKPKGRAKAASKAAASKSPSDRAQAPAEDSPKVPTKPLPKQVQKYMAMSDEEKMEYVATLSEAQQIKLVKWL